jgi:hypothetical protein
VRVVGVVAAADVREDDLAEGVRVLLGLHAAGHAVAIRECGTGVGRLAPDASLPAETERALEALAEDSVVPEGPEGLADAIARADAVLVLASPARSGEPAVLALRRGERPSRADLEAIASAGCVVLE